MVEIYRIKTAVKLCLTMMGCVRDRCRCCFSAESLEALQPPILDVLKLIRIPQDVKIDDFPTEACFKCHNFLKDVHRFRKKCHAVDEIFRNNLQDVKHEVDLLLKNADDDDLPVVHVKKELLVEFDENEQIHVEINKTEADSESDGSQDGFETYPQDPLVLINEIDCPENSLLSELNERKYSSKKSLKKKTKSKLTAKNIKRDPTSDEGESGSKVVKRAHKPYKKKHLTEKPFECEECSYKCKRPSTLQIHLRTHRGEKPFSCDLCDYKCVVKSSLMIHMRNKHSTQRPYSCDQCEYRSKSKGAMIIHKRLHSDPKHYMCELCSYGSTILSNLQCHIRRAHTGERPFICDRCPYRTVSGGLLRKHIQRHDDYKKFSCSECSFVGNSLEGLRTHMTKHTGNKLQCHLCSATFTVKNSYKRHLIKQHAMSPEKVQNTIN